MVTTQTANVDDALAKLEQLNEEVAPLNIWLRTKANSPAQQPWYKTDIAEKPKVAAGALSSGLHAVPYHWRWKDVKPYLEKVSELCPLELTERQQLHLRNPGLGGSLRIANSIRVAISIYKPGDDAPVHIHTPNASRTILSRKGGHTIVEGERCEAERADVIFTPNGTWHEHGNDSDEPVIWMDVLDWPVMEFLDAIWVDDEQPPELANANLRGDLSKAMYGRGGLRPRYEPVPRGIGQKVTPIFRHHGSDVLDALADLSCYGTDPYDGATVEMVNPRTGGPAFPALSYRAHRYEEGTKTLAYRHTASTVYCVIEGRGRSHVGDQVFDWEPNDVFVVPNHTWRHHEIADEEHAVLYAVSDAPFVDFLGHYRSQGRDAAGNVVELDTAERG